MKRYPMAHRIQLPAVPYRASFDTDVRATIKRVRKEQAAAQVEYFLRAAVMTTPPPFAGTVTPFNPKRYQK